MDLFNTFYFAALKQRFKKKGHTKRKIIPKEIILPGRHQTDQDFNTNPASADSPSSSTYSPKG